MEWKLREGMKGKNIYERSKGWWWVVTESFKAAVLLYIVDQGKVGNLGWLGWFSLESLKADNYSKLKIYYFNDYGGKWLLEAIVLLEKELVLTSLNIFI